MIEGYIDQDQRPDLGDLLRLTVTISLPDECVANDIHIAFQAGCDAVESIEQFCNSGSITNSAGIAYSGRQRPAMADCRLFRKWMAMCNESHYDCSEHTRSGARLRFVDVKQMCITEINEDDKFLVPYVALSYVWGNANTLLLTRANHIILTQQQALLSVDIPLTISDAILMTEKLGQRYLWVDSLCIIQDDKNDVSRFIHLMDIVYSNSEVTIVAASGADAECWTPGVAE